MEEVLATSSTAQLTPFFLIPYLFFFVWILWDNPNLKPPWERFVDITDFPTDLYYRQTEFLSGNNVILVFLCH